MERQTVIAEIPGSTRNEQLIVCLVESGGRGWKVELLDQRWAEGIGWYNQKVIDLEPAQWRALQQSFASHPQAAAMQTPLDPPATVPFVRRPSPPLPRSVADGA